MSEFVCKKKCFYRDRLWEKGETLKLKEGEKCPSHFGIYNPKTATKDEQMHKEASTFVELQRQEAKEVLASVQGAPIEKEENEEKEDFLE